MPQGLNDDLGFIWRVYLLRCRGAKLYTGIAIDVHRRLRQHRAGKGSRFVASQLPAELAMVSWPMTLREALRLEREIKRLPASQKLDALKLQYDPDFPLEPPDA